MSALAQYLAGTGKSVSGSDRFFIPGEPNETKEKLEAEGIKCFLQDAAGIHASTNLVIASTAVEETNIEIQKAESLAIPILLPKERLQSEALPENPPPRPSCLISWITLAWGRA